VFHIPHQTGPIRVVPKNFPVPENQGIHRPSQLGPFRAALAEAVGFFLEGHGHIGPLAPGGNKGGHGPGEIVLGDQQGFVTQVLAGGGSEAAMDEGGFAMGDGIAENGVAVGHDRREISGPGAGRRW